MTRKKEPQKALLVGMTPEQQKEFTEAWKSCHALVAPIRARLQAVYEAEIDVVLRTGVGIERSNEARSNAKAIAILASLLPEGEET